MSMEDDAVAHVARAQRHLRLALADLDRVVGAASYSPGEALAHLDGAAEAMARAHHCGVDARRLLLAARVDAAGVG